MSQKQPVALIARLAVQLKMLTPDQVRTALRAQAKEGGDRPLSGFFLELGYLNSTQLAKLEVVQQQVLAKQRASTPAPAASPPATAAPVAEPAAVVELDSPVRSATEAPVAPQPSVAPAVDSPAELQLDSPMDSSAPTPREPTAKPVPRAAIQAEAQSPEESLGLSLPTPGDSDRTRLEGLLGQAVQAKASDVHIHSGAPVRMRMNGQFRNVNDEVVDRDAAGLMVSAALDASQRQQLVQQGELDFCIDLPGVGRFRANAYCQQRGLDVVFRSIPAAPPTLEELGLPPELAKYTEYHQGMVLITGPAGCGKSSTLAALVNLINEQREEHILTVEDPIEVIHPSKKCLVNQRHAGHHTSSFARALRGALREDPDIIVIGELRDLETISLAMTAAETGHFVLATLHTNNAVRTISRMIGAFPSNQQAQVRTMLSESLRAVISQRLVPSADEKSRLPALEILVINKAIGNLIRDEKTVQIRSSIQTGKNQGMCLLEQSLDELVRSKKITKEAALELAEDKKLITGS